MGCFQISYPLTVAGDTFVRKSYINFSIKSIHNKIEMILRFFIVCSTLIFSTLIFCSSVGLFSIFFFETWRFQFLTLTNNLKNCAWSLVKSLYLPFTVSKTFLLPNAQASLFRSMASSLFYFFRVLTLFSFILNERYL